MGKVLAHASPASQGHGSMGHFRFFAPSHVQLPREALNSAYLVGMEGIPWRSSNRWLTPPDASPVEFTLERAFEESGCLNIPWYVSGYGWLMLATASLRESDVSYCLPLELARGTVNRLRNQAADWQLFGVVLPPELQARISEAAAAFIEAVTCPPTADAAASAANRAIRLALEAGEELCAEYTRQVLQVRHQHAERLPVLLGCRLASRPLQDVEQSLVTTTFNAAAISLPWRLIEQTAGRHDWDLIDRQMAWCRQQGLRIVGGPLLQLDPAHLPDWLYLWEDDIDQVQAYLAQFIREAVARYRGSVKIWHCASGMNVPGAISLTEGQRLRILVNSVEEIQRLDPQTPVILTFDRPWAEYLTVNDRELTPLQIADSLVRADLGLAGIGVELNIGCPPGGSYLRELVEVNRLLDRWSMLGLPLLVYLTWPSSDGPDGQARYRVSSFYEQATPRTQVEYARQLVSLLLARPNVHGIIWNQLSDADAHLFAHSGLFDAQSAPKPLAGFLAELRQQHLE